MGRVSCLTVTSGKRQAFKEWLLWNYRKQDHPDTELVVVSDDAEWPQDVRVVQMDANIPTKRNAALRAASGRFITWFDDDDWQSPQKCSILARELKTLGRGSIVSCNRSFFMEVASRKVKPVESLHFPLFNGMGIHAADALAIDFDESRDRASDTTWINNLLSGSIRKKKLLPTLLFFWLSHSDNISNSARSIRPENDNVHNFGINTWLQLKKLEKRLGVD